jgi:glutaredoxin
VTIKNINNGAVRNEFLHKGGTGVPFTHSKTTGEKVTGLPPNIQTLCATLAPETTIRKSSIKERLNNLQIKIYTTPTCEACNIYKDFLRKHKLIDYVTIIDVTKISDVENDPYLKTNSLPAYPFTYSQTYQTSFAGTPRSVEDIFIFLENQGT